MVEAQELMRNIETELGRLQLIVSIDDYKRNPLVKKYIQKLRVIMAKLREVEKCHRTRLAQSEKGGMNDGV